MRLIFTPNKQAALLPNVFSTNLNVSQSYWLHIQSSGHPLREVEENSR